jgi:spermidine synthase
MGFTLRAALDAAGPDARVTVAELSPAVVRWNRGPLAALSGDSASDPRVTIREADVGAVIREGRNAYDAIMLDVDNGPDGLVYDTNGWLYEIAGLAAAQTALRPGGVLTVWSAGPDRSFTPRLRQVGFKVEEVIARARGAKGGARHTIWVAAKP